MDPRGIARRKMKLRDARVAVRGASARASESKDPARKASPKIQAPRSEHLPSKAAQRYLLPDNIWSSTEASFGGQRAWQKRMNCKADAPTGWRLRTGLALHKQSRAFDDGINR